MYVRIHIYTKYRVPHRSAANLSNMPRRAVFLTYNPRSEGPKIKIANGTKITWKKSQVECDHAVSRRGRAGLGTKKVYCSNLKVLLVLLLQVLVS